MQYGFKVKGRGIAPNTLDKGPRSAPHLKCDFKSHFSNVSHGDINRILIASTHTGLLWARNEQYEEMTTQGGQ